MSTLDSAQFVPGPESPCWLAAMGNADEAAEQHLKYQEFLRSKAVVAIDRGMEPGEMNPNLKPHAAAIAQWAIRGGARAIFASFGLHKTSIQLQILESIIQQREGSGLIICPLGVKREFVRESQDRSFSFTPVYVRTDAELKERQAEGHRHFLTNYERVRDGDIDPNLFMVVCLDESSVLRSFGSKTYQTFLTLFDKVPFKFVATATPDPNRTKELIHYAAFLGVMDSGHALTRFFKRDSTQAGNLQLHPHKVREFWLWISTWACFIEFPSDLGFDDAGYVLPALKVIRHRLPVDHGTAGFDSWGQGKLLRNAALSLSDASREKRDSLGARVAEAARIIDAGGKDRHWIVWHDLEDERRALKETFPEMAMVYGTQDLEEREGVVADFADGRLGVLGTKPSLCGSGCNLQRHCRSAIFLGIGFKFNDFIQAVHRIFRFGQTGEVEIHLIYTESEDHVYNTLMAKWARHKERLAKMTAIVREYGLTNIKHGAEMRRSIGVKRKELKGDLFTAVNNDNVLELERMPGNSIDLIVSSWPFSDHYEYSESYNDFGHNDGDEGFFRQMEFLTPHTMRVLGPGRIYCVHAKDRVVYGSVSGDGMYAFNEFSDKCVAHMKRHGFRYCGRITIDTDVVRENNQTYRLTYSEQCKDGTKMGVGSPEYILIFRKLPSDLSNSYADTPVVKSKDDYKCARWQFDAAAFWRSRGDRFLTPEEITALPLTQLREMWLTYSATHIYDHEQHVAIAQALEDAGTLPGSFMLLSPKAHGENIWADIVRMRTLNMEQESKAQEMHVCPLQFDVVERLIRRYSNPGELILDPFGGLGTVAYCAVKMKRRGYSIELSESYHRDACGYLKAMELQVSSPTLFDLEDLSAA